jgi:hypothetical protein
MELRLQNVLLRGKLQMSIDYDMMLRTDLIVYSKLFCAYFSGLALLRHWLAEPDCANVPQAPFTHTPRDEPKEIHREP